MAANVGLMRNITAHRDGRQLDKGRTDDAWGRHIEGALGEYAAAKHLNVCWTPSIGKLDTAVGDVAGYQVRSTTRQNGSLIVHPADNDDHVFILVTLNLTKPEARVVGHITGRAAKHDRYWRADLNRPAFFIPQHALDPRTH